MAANANVFTDKETNNWFKAYIALNITKEGLASFVDTELQKISAAVGQGCGNCTIENLIPCPTQGFCKKRTGNNCTFHKTKLYQPCPRCDQVYQNIKYLHRFRVPSWHNTRSEKWATDPWKIGKCYLPPDGYTGVSSVQESNFNRLISVLLNCTHFATCLSPPCLSPAPPDKQCPLEKVRMIGRVVRHTADCKVTDADLQDYFQTLATLLADPICLNYHPSATLACSRLSDLQNDHLPPCEYGELMKASYQALEQDKTTGKSLSDNAENTLAEGLNKIKDEIAKLEKKAEDVTSNLKVALNDALLQIERQRFETIETIYERAQGLKQEVVDEANKAEHAVAENQRDLTTLIDRKVQDGVHALDEHARDSIRRINQSGTDKLKDDYTNQAKDICKRLIDHYNDTASSVPLYALDRSFDKRLKGIYSTPKYTEST